MVGSSASPLRLTTDPAADTRPRWSPDRKSIAFVRSTAEVDTIMLNSALGGAERRVTVFPTAIEAGMSWSPDSKWLAVAAGPAPVLPRCALFPLTLASREFSRRRRHGRVVISILNFRPMDTLWHSSANVE